MNNQLAVFFGDELYESAEAYLETLGLDVQSVCKMALKKVVREQSIAFLLPSSTSQTPIAVPAPTAQGSDKMTKTKAISLLRSQGFDIEGNVTFASRNQTVNVYWGNPAIGIANATWSIILRDSSTRQLHLFTIPMGAINPDILPQRRDKAQYDLRIQCDDPTFNVIGTSLNLKQFYQTTIQY